MTWKRSRKDAADAGRGRRRGRPGQDSAGRSRRGGSGSVRVLVYSSDRITRATVIESIGRRPDPTLPEVDFIEVATAPMVLRHMDGADVDVAILDGETAPTGGLGLAKQLKDEIDECPPVLVLIGRREDAWLAEWSRAEDAVPHPLDPFELSRAAVALIDSVVGERTGPEPAG